MYFLLIYRFYVGCEHCSNWFHGDCVGVTEEMSKTMEEYVCPDCRRAEETQELYCLCRQPYDNSQYVLLISILFFFNSYINKPHYNV